MSKYILLLTFLFLVSCVLAEKKRFDNFKSYDLKIENDEQLKMLQAVEALEDGVCIKGSAFYIAETFICTSYSFSTCSWSHRRKLAWQFQYWCHQPKKLIFPN
jgi:hypothetical protein